MRNSPARRILVWRAGAQQIVGRERRERVSQLTWCGGGCFDSRRRVNSTVRHLRLNPNETSISSLHAAGSTDLRFCRSLIGGMALVEHVSLDARRQKEI